MFAQNLLRAKRLLWLIPLTALLISPVGTFPAAASSSAYMLDIQTTVPVSNLNLFPPNPCAQGIQLTGDFVIRAHIVFPPTSIFPPVPVMPAGTNITLQLDATRISGVGLTDGTLYQGTQGTSQEFQYSPNPMVYDTAFDLVPSQPDLYPPSPCSPAHLTFLVQIYTAEGGIPALSASIETPDGSN